MLVVADARHFSAFLGGVIFVGQPAFGVRFDFERVRLYAIGGGDHLVVRLFGPSNPRCALCSVVSEGRLVSLASKTSAALRASASVVRARSIKPVRLGAESGSAVTRSIT